MTKTNLTTYIISGAILTACVGNTNSNNSSTNIQNGITPPATQVQNGSVVTDPAINSRLPLIYTQLSESSGEICTGSLLDANTVLTAAHCVINMHQKAVSINYTNKDINQLGKIMIILPKNLKVAVNINDNSNQTMDDWNVYAPAKIYVHPQAFYGVDIDSSGGLDVIDQSNVNDLAIIKLKTDVASQYQFVQLATTNPTVNTSEIIAGFGVDVGAGVVKKDATLGDSGVLRMANSMVAAVNSDGSYIDVGGRMGKTGYTKICQGDSGGPDLIANLDLSYTITGVHSYGSGANCGLPTDPSSSVSIAHYQYWISGGYLTNHL